MKFSVQDNRRDNDGSKFLYLTPENQAESCQIDNLIHKLNQWNIIGNEFDLGQDGIKSLGIRILHLDAGRKNGMPITINSIEKAAKGAEEMTTRQEKWQQCMDNTRVEMTGLEEMRGRDPGPIPDDFMPELKNIAK